VGIAPRLIDEFCKQFGPPGSLSRAAPLPVFRRHDLTLTTRPDFRLFPLFCALFFLLLLIVLALPAFLTFDQGLAL
jgi:hypothetical protein